MRPDWIGCSCCDTPVRLTAIARKEIVDRVLRQVDALGNRHGVETAGPEAENVALLESHDHRSPPFRLADGIGNDDTLSERECTSHEKGSESSGEDGRYASAGMAHRPTP